MINVGYHVVEIVDQIMGKNNTIYPNIVGSTHFSHKRIDKKMKHLNRHELWLPMLKMTVILEYNSFLVSNHTKSTLQKPKGYYTYAS